MASENIVGDEPGDTKISWSMENGVTRIINEENQLMLILADKKYED